MKRSFCLLAMVGLVGFLAGCDNANPPQTTTVELSPQATDTAKGGESDGDILIKFINADENAWSGKGRQEQVQRGLRDFINNRQYEIVRVTTTNTRDSYLFSAIVYYRIKK